VGPAFFEWEIKDDVCESVWGGKPHEEELSLYRLAERAVDTERWPSMYDEWSKTIVDAS
jgi:hypothetical protein